MSEGSLKILDQTLTTLHLSVRAFNYLRSCDWDKARFALSGFFGWGGLGCQLKPDLGHNPRIERLQCDCNLVWLIAVVKQNRNLRDVRRLGTKIVQVLA